MNKKNKRLQDNRFAALFVLHLIEILLILLVLIKIN
jgi:hypothetical protein